MENKNKIRCPICNKADTWKADNVFRPFCSERCKIIDLGEWADESHHIPGQKINPEPDEDKGPE
ncbi:MAG TPA: DNA gyrase inhibitor YacG [Gammaproteobacteria bacterium]|nr:DNA gyrase inhibitor YacG [Gammaproteobacteria bacterium]